jgi:hypothetical protein
MNGKAAIIYVNRVMADRLLAIEFIIFHESPPPKKQEREYTIKSWLGVQKGAILFSF